VPNTGDCVENALLRRQLTRRGLFGAGVSFYAWAHLNKVASAAGARDPRFLIVILRGAMDGLSAVPPIGDPNYERARGDIALPKTGTDAVIPLDGFFALHPSMKTFARMYKAKQAAVVHAVATPYRERSHFDGQDLLESGYDRVTGRVDSGWLNRVLQQLPYGGRVERPLAVGIGPATPLILRGSAPVLGWAPQIQHALDDDLTGRLLRLYSETDPVLAKNLQAGLKTEQMSSAGMQAEASKSAMQGMAMAAAGAARLLAAPDGPRIAALSFDGWDTHANQGGVKGRLANLLEALDTAFAAFEAGLGPVWNDTTILVVTEFGRTVHVNGTKGSDHGTGTVSFLLGGAIKGGRVIADWPGLSAGQLHQGRDLNATTDLRSIVAGILVEGQPIDKKIIDEKIFPGSKSVPIMRDVLKAS
jgi:uncharacterized protein (DUF1501 family)